ncbi:Uncharacterised protein [Acinetobacter baumannii]|nr:Uncharacterised protein [Acinetobacter baumannii]
MAGWAFCQVMPLSEPACHMAASMARSSEAVMISQVLVETSTALMAMPTMISRKPAMPCRQASR